jgi:hypothetical protein
MRFTQFCHYGHDLCDYRLSLINIKKYSVFQISVDYDPVFCAPFIQMTIGGGSLIELFVIAGFFSFDIEFLGRTWQKLPQDDKDKRTFLDGILTEEDYSVLKNNGMLAAYFGGEILIEEIYAFLRDQGE